MPCSNVDDADVFFGNEEVNLPTPQGIAADWNWLKAIAGNTHTGPHGQWAWSPSAPIPVPIAPFIRKARHHRFEGLNNEPDMETPYAYIFAGRHDRACEVLRAVMRWQFAPGKGGLPGNNDSGALSSWFVWSAMGIFPVR